MDALALIPLSGWLPYMVYVIDLALIWIFASRSLREFQ